MSDKTRNTAILVIALTLLLGTASIDRVTAQLRTNPPQITVPTTPMQIQNIPVIQRMTPSALEVYQKASATATITGPGLRQLDSFVKVIRNGALVPGVTAQLNTGALSDTRTVTVTAAANASIGQGCTLQFVVSGTQTFVDLNSTVGHVNINAYQAPVITDPRAGTVWYLGSPVSIRGRGNPGQLYEFRLMPNSTYIPRAQADANGNIQASLTLPATLQARTDYWLQMYTTGVSGPDYAETRSQNFQIAFQQQQLPRISSVLPNRLKNRQQVSIRGAYLSPRSQNETTRILIHYGQFKYEVDAVRIGPDELRFTYPGEPSKHILWGASDTKTVGIQLVLDGALSNVMNITIEKDFVTPSGGNPTDYKKHDGIIGDKGDDLITVRPPDRTYPDSPYVVDHIDIVHTNTADSNVSVVTSQNDLTEGQQIKVHWWFNIGSNASYTIIWKYRVTYNIDESRVR